MAGPKPLVTWRVIDPGHPIYGGVWTGPLGECIHATCPRKATHVVEPTGTDINTGTRDEVPGLPPQGFCRGHLPRLVPYAEYERRWQPRGERLWCDRWWRTRSLRSAEQAAIDAVYHWEPTSGPDGRIAALRRVLEGGRPLQIDGVQVEPIQASLVLAIHDGLNARNRQRYAQETVPVMVGIAMVLAGI